MEGTRSRVASPKKVQEHSRVDAKAKGPQLRNAQECYGASIRMRLLSTSRTTSASVTSENIRRCSWLSRTAIGPEEAERYWQIFPPLHRNVIPMTQASDDASCRAMTTEETRGVVAVEP
jgi:hypothetical protein